jgi:putative ABC transport system permease protein
MDKLALDIRYSFRTLAKNPGFAFIAILVLALGIGATAAIFSVANAVLLRPLPYANPAWLVAVSSEYQRNGVANTFATVSLNEVERWRADSQSLASLGSFVFSALPVNVGSHAMFLVAIGADPEFLSTLGIQPALGRNLPGSGSKLKDPSVIISHHLWVEAFHSDPQVIGRALTMDGTPAVVAGVLSASFQFPRSDASYFPEDPELIYPVANIADDWGRNSTQWFAIGRLKSGASISRAETELKTITARMASSDPSLRGMSAHLSALNAETTSTVRPALLLSLAISMVLLLIACTNIMNLLFSRAAQRGREMAVRKAVGATTARLVRQMLTESACLTFLSGVIGLALARFALNFLVALSPAHLPISGRVEIEWTVLGFTFGVCALAAILTGVLPAIQRGRQNESLISASRASSSRALLTFQHALMVAQIALAVGLLASAGLLTHSLLHLSSVDPGFRTRGTLAFELAFPSGRGRYVEIQRLSQRILEATRSVPGVISAGWITNPPPETRAGMFVPFSIVGSQSATRPFCNFQVTSEDYFSTAGIAITRGRDFTLADSANAPRVAIINETLARQFFPHADPIGQHITAPMEGTTPIEIVGVISDVHDRGLSAKSPSTIYAPYQQFALAYGGIVARTSAAPESVIPELRRRIAQTDPTVPLRAVSTIDARLHKTLDAPRFYTIMAIACAFMAILFVTLGLYGVISYGVSRRTSEIGIRMALGAPSEKILRGVLLQALAMAAIGVVLGLAISVAATRLLRSLLFEIQPIDPATLSLAAALVIVVTLAASFLPARHASRVEPLIALRHE